MHKEDCSWKDGYFESLTACDPTGPDASLSIDQDGIFYTSNIYTTNSDDYYIKFKFCPICGVEL